MPEHEQRNPGMVRQLRHPGTSSEFPAMSQIPGCLVKPGREEGTKPHFGRRATPCSTWPPLPPNHKLTVLRRRNRWPPHTTEDPLPAASAPLPKEPAAAALPTTAASPADHGPTAAIGECPVTTLKFFH